MARQDLAFIAFNRGLVSRLGLARADVRRITLSAALFKNFMPRVLGSMAIRPGLGFRGNTRSNKIARYLSFVFAIDDKALIELTSAEMRVWVDEQVVTRIAVSTVITNGDFATDLSGWTDDDESGAASTWVSGTMQLLGTGQNAAIRTQAVSVAGADSGKEHALRINIARGPVTLFVGSSAGADDYVRETQLEEGVHSLTFIPSGATFYIRFQSRLQRLVFVSDVSVEAAGDMVVPAPWAEADLGRIRKVQSGDILFIAARGYAQYKIERRSTHSWSIVKYQTEDGPYRTRAIDKTTLVVNALTGNGTMFSNTPVFKVGHLGALFTLVQSGQRAVLTVVGDNQFTLPIEITGAGSVRAFTVRIAGIDASPPATVTLQRAFTTPDVWAAVTTYTADTITTVTDGLDNQITFYRLAVLTGNNAGGATIVLDISTGIGSTRGVVRVTGITNNSEVSVEILKPIGDSVNPTVDWLEGRWSTYRGYPSAVAIYEGRLAWAGKDIVGMTVSDDYYNYSPDTEGDSGPIVRSIGSGPVDVINWLMPLERLLMGGQGAEHACRSNSLDDILTPTNFKIKKPSRQGSADVEAVEIDDNGVFVQRGGMRVFELNFSGEKLDYKADHLSALVPEVGEPGIVRLAVQRQPDTRVHCLRSDGTVAIVVFDKVEGVTCWLTADTPAADGFVEDIVIEPGNPGEKEDHVFYQVRRTIAGNTVRYLEKWAYEDDCIGGTISKLGDSYITLGAGPLTGLDHLEGEPVVVWMDGKDVGTDENGDLIYTVQNGALPLTAVTGAVVGLPYTAQWQSGKLTELRTQIGLALKADKTISQLGMILANVHRFGLKFGPDFEHLDDMPSMEFGAPVDPDAVRFTYDEQSFPFPGTYTTDQRICLQAQAPRPVTILAITAAVEHHG
jgi:hypothetical protein